MRRPPPSGQGGGVLDHSRRDRAPSTASVSLHKLREIPRRPTLLHPTHPFRCSRHHYPSSSPAPGPMSITLSLPATTRISCSTTTTVFPAYTSPSPVSPSRA